VSIFGVLAVAQESFSSGRAFAEHAEQLERNAEAERFVAAQSKLPGFQSDQEIDGWLRQQSAFYSEMAEVVDGRGGYSFRPLVREPENAAIAELVSGTLYDKGERWICIHDSIRASRRVAVIIFEMSNLYQERKHWEVDWDIVHERITSADVYAIARELIEYDGLRLERRVLEELDHALGGLPLDFLAHYNPKATTLTDYQVPPAYDVIRHQATTGHRQHYREVFLRHVGEAKEMRAELRK